MTTPRREVPASLTGTPAVVLGKDPDEAPAPVAPTTTAKAKAAAGTPVLTPPAPPVPVDDEDEADDDDGPGRRAPRLTLRAVAFGVALALLMAAVPALGWVGKDRLLDSQGGEIVGGSTNDPTAPGYSQLVTPTQTALVVHRDAAGAPTSATILSQSAADAGGTALLVPLQLQPVEGSYFQRVIDGWSGPETDDGFRRSIEDVIRVSVPPPIIDVTDESLATLVAPVAPLEITVNDPVTDENGVIYEGNVSLSAEAMGPYMRATREGELEIARLERLRDVWAAWLAAIGDSELPEPIGAAATGMGTYLRVLGAGDPVVETLDVEEQPDYLKGTSYVPAEGMDAQVLAAVPFPDTPREGTRIRIRLLNGAEGAPLPSELMRELIAAGGSLAWLGNAGELGQDTTTIAYKDSSWRPEAELVQALLGDGVEVEQMSQRRAESETVDMVITIGSDVLSRYEE